MNNTVNNTDTCTFLCDPNVCVTTVAVCWMLKLRNGRVLGFTNHDEDIEVNGLVYYAKSGVYSVVDVSHHRELVANDMDVAGILDNDFIKESDILAGLYDHAEILMFLVDYNTKPVMSVLKLRRGWLGEVKFSTNAFVAEVRGLLHLFKSQIGDVYSPCCRAQFCDKVCKMNLQTFTKTNLSISSVINNAVFYFIELHQDPTISECTMQQNHADLNQNTEFGVGCGVVDSALQDSVLQDSVLQNRQSTHTNILPYTTFSNGVIKFTTGANTGISMEIVNCGDDRRLATALPFPYKVSVGDEFEMVAGCNKTFTMCSKIYKNAVNFRGEPHIPNPSDVLRTLR